MPDDQTRKFDLPWGTLLPLLGVLAGVIVQFKPLLSPRPPVPNEKAAPVTAKQDVDARLWQDPIGVAEKQNALPDAEIRERHNISVLRKLLADRVTSFPGNVLLLGVMLDAGPYSEQAESRLRFRQAILEGLSESGFVPVDGEHIGFVTAPWPPPIPDPPSPSIDRPLLIPWEECEARDDPEKVFPRGTKRIFVMWLPAANFDPDPLSRFAGLINYLAPLPGQNLENPEKISVKLIGPANSTGLQNMIHEVRWFNSKGLSEITRKALDGVWIISPLATASDEALLSSPASDSNPNDPCHGKSVKQCLEDSVPTESKDDPRHGLHFVRTVATDETVLRELIAELKRRRIATARQVKPPTSKPAHIVLLSEWDTYYGRSLSTTFASLAAESAKTGGDSETTFASGLTVPSSTASDASPLIHSYYYLRGIDGQLPGDVAKENQRDTAQRNQLGQETIPVEATEGLNQSDYLRRLARKLKEYNTGWQRRDGFGIGAIGLLGSDIYDKLMILRALRPQFRGVVFFTNNYDAHFERRDVWDDTRNLVICSPFNGVLPETFERSDPGTLPHRPVAPFRDTNQTSMYAGALVATNKMDQSVAEHYRLGMDRTSVVTTWLAFQPRIFEVSRYGAYDLSPPWYLPGRGLSYSSQNWFRDWLFPKWAEEERKLARDADGGHQRWFFANGVVWQSPVFWRLVISALALLGIAAWISITIASRTLPGGGTTRQRLKRVFASTIFWVVCGVPLIVFSVAILAQYRGADVVQYGGAAQEPLAFLSGISIWPSEMLRLIALMLAIHFMIKANIDLRANERKLAKLFGFGALPSTRFCWADLGIGLEQWQVPPSNECYPKKEFSAEEAWHAYLRRHKFWPRFIRIGILFGLYFLFSFAIYSLFPPAPAPARGDFAFQFDHVVTFMAAIGMMILTFYVVDAIQLNSNFIRMFAREVTKWGRTVTQSSHRSPPLSEEELSAYHEIFFVAQRTEVVARLIWYPLIVLSIMFVARWSFFDNWTWPASLVIIFALNAAWPIGSAMFLRRTAEQLRDATLSNLQLSRIKDRAVEAKRETLDELIDEIRGLKKGAFAPLTEQPFVRAMLVPSGGLGLLAVGQRLLEGL